MKKNLKSELPTSNSEVSADEHEAGLFEFYDEQEARAFEAEIANLDRNELIQLILRDRQLIASLWSTLLKKNSVVSRRKSKELLTKKAKYDSAKIFGVPDFSALVLQAIQAASDTAIGCVRAKLVELRLKDPSNGHSEDELRRHAARELTSEKLRTIKRQLKSVPF